MHAHEENARWKRMSQLGLKIAFAILICFYSDTFEKKIANFFVHRWRRRHNSSQLSLNVIELIFCNNYVQMDWWIHIFPLIDLILDVQKPVAASHFRVHFLNFILEERALVFVSKFLPFKKVIQCEIKVNV